MSVHAWVRNNLAAYVTGGLNATARRRLERHVRDCAECARALDEARAVDGDLTALFADVRPGPELEEEAIRRLRRPPPRPERRAQAWKVRWLVASAAAVLLASSGAGLSALMDEDKLRFPGAIPPPQLLEGLSRGDDSRSVVAQNSLKQVGVATRLEGRGYDGRSGELKTPEMLAQEKRKETLGFYEPALALVVKGRSGVHRNPFDGFMDASTDRGKYQVMDGTSNNVAFSPDGKVLLSGAQTPRYGLPNGEKGIDWGLADGSVRIVNGRVEDGPPVEFPGVERLRKRLAATESAYFKPGDAFAQLGPQDPAKSGEGESSKQGRGKGGGQSQTPPGDGEKGQGQKEGQDKSKPGTEKAPAREEGKTKGVKKPEVPKQHPQPMARKVIRSGEVDFEVPSFDTASATIHRLVKAIPGAYVSTVNSDKLENGKMSGAVVVRVPPDKLDDLVVALRKELGKTGELKGQRIGSQDITKQYTDLESRLRAAKTIEERLLKIIRDGKGEIKDLVAAETQLGIWRTKVEELEGELRYYAHQVALSSLKVNLTEKNIRSAAAVTERERVQAGLEVEDVEVAMQAVLDAVDEAGGRVTRSELKQKSAGQFNALLHFEIAPAKAGPMRDRLRQIGTVTRLEIDRVQHPEGGTMPRDGRLRRGDTQFQLSLYNLANVAPRETVTLKLAASDVAASYRKLRAAVAKAQGRVANSQLNEQDHQNVTAQLDFDIRRAAESAMQAALTATGEQLSRNVTRAAEGENVTDAKVLFKVELVPATAIPPREIVALAVEVADVEGTLAVLAARVKEAGGAVVDTQTAQERSGRVTARVIYRVPLTAAPGVVDKVKSSGQVRLQQLGRNPQAPEGKLAVAKLDVTLSNVELLVPSEQGLWAQVRHGLGVSLRGLSLSASWLIVGLLFVLPWLLLIYAVIWLVRRLWYGGPGPARTSPAPAGGGTGATAG
jgi:hypothetical protein